MIEKILKKIFVDYILLCHDYHEIAITNNLTFETVYEYLKQFFF
jgi:hypothetical protein